MSQLNGEQTRRLIATRDRAYVPYSHHPVGALIEADDGSLYLGCNVEVAHYKGLCAEASAIAAMITAGHRTIRAAYVLGPGDHLCTPCGDCRQRLREFATPETRIHVLNANGVALKHYRMEDLLPDSFGPENLNDCT
ncbi:cytidine deaminase [Aidingimonas halophila]|uniref:Cytidine deaminase n=1 Tax=Aidingimonas halophila TaxID=574349 RepID=A0A1H3E7F0_9GAMM|nr:cytidine deaminase [Aidingimonas halophila]GHC33961.1 cytidine deaminase [Aidingimonas halophila]SDX74663.1 cytidine deaminase [Aidingimonas halophila]